MTLHGYARTLRRHWVAIVLFAMLGGLAGFAHATTTPASYRSTAKVLLTADIGGSASEIFQSSNYVQNIVASYVFLATSDVVLDEVIDELDLDTTSRALARSITVESPLNTVVLEISVIADDPELAEQIAQSITTRLSDAVARVSPVGRGKRPILRLTTIDNATTPTAPISPNRRREALLGVLVGLALGAAYAITRRSLGEKVRDAEDVTGVTDLPVVGEIVQSGPGTPFLPAVLNDVRGPQSESVQGLVANLNFLDLHSGLSAVVITSSTPQESKSSVAAALATSVAGSGKKVLLIDCDLRNPSLGQLTGLENAVGVSNVISGQYLVKDAIQGWLPGVDVLTAGPVPPNPAQILSSPRFAELVEDLKTTYDFLIIDSAPVLVAADAVWLGHCTDGVLLLCRRGKVSTAKLARALEVLRTGQTETLGIVLTRIRSRRGRYGRYGKDVSEFAAG